MLVLYSRILNVLNRSPSYSINQVYYSLTLLHKGSALSSKWNTKRGNEDVISVYYSLLRPKST